MSDAYPRVVLDVTRYIKESQTRPCFICGLIDNPGNRAEHVIHRDDQAIVFLNKFPTLIGYTIVAPVEHRTEVVGDFDLDDYLDLQRIVHRVGRAISTVVPCERLYVLSLGSHQGNAHVHWHLAPLPPGVPDEQQQFRALMMEERGYLDIPNDDQTALAARILAAMT